MHRNLLFTSAGDASKCYEMWCDKDRTYDIFVCYYGKALEQDRYLAVADYVLERKGSKFQNFFHIWTNDCTNEMICTPGRRLIFISEITMRILLWMTTLS